MTPDPALLERIYRRPEFIWARFVRGVEERLAQWLRNLAFGDGPWAWLGLGLVAAAVACGLIWWLRRRQAPARSARARSAQAPAALAPAQLEREAAAAADAGDWAAAIRSLYRAFVLQLDQHGRLRFDPARTNRELRRLLASGPSLEPFLSEMIAAAEQVTYAGVAGDEQLWQQTDRAYRSLVQQLQVGGKPA